MHATAPLTIAIALTAGIFVQILAFHLRIPAIVLLLGCGFLLGPEFLGLVQPSTLGSGLLTLIGFAVAVILFEGGMNLRIARLRREQLLIRRLVTWGGLVTAAGGMLSALAILRWDFTTSLLFGTLVMVTGPTVVTPLLRRINVLPSLHTVLEAEGVIIDAVGALVAVLTLEIVMHPTGHSVAMGFASMAMRLGGGAGIGFLGGAVTALFLRFEHVVPERLVNVFALAMAIVTFQVSNALISESGLVAIIVAGLLVGNVRTRMSRELLEFKEQLTSMFIGMLFVLLSANLRWEEMRRLGGRGLLVVLCLMAVVRPLSVWLCTRGTGVGWREQAFMSWLAPRGIVAAAVASLFAQTLDAQGMPGGGDLRAMVFLVIVCTVALQGTLAPLVATLLRVRQPRGPACVLVGANALARVIAKHLQDAGTSTVLIDLDRETQKTAERAGLRAIHGNAIEEKVLRDAGVDQAKALVALTGNEAINLVCAREAIQGFRVRRAYVAVDRRRSGLGLEAVRATGARILFGNSSDLRAWIGLCEQERVQIEKWRRKRKSKDDLRDRVDSDGPLFLPLLVFRSKRRFVVDERWSPRAKDEILVSIVPARADEAHTALAACGWEPAPPVSKA